MRESAVAAQAMWVVLWALVTPFACWAVLRGGRIAIAGAGVWVILLALCRWWWWPSPPVDGFDASTQPLWKERLGVVPWTLVLVSLAVGLIAAWRYSRRLDPRRRGRGDGRDRRGRSSFVDEPERSREKRGADPAGGGDGRASHAQARPTLVGAPSGIRHARIRRGGVAIRLGGTLPDGKIGHPRVRSGPVHVRTSRSSCGGLGVGAAFFLLCRGRHRRDLHQDAPSGTRSPSDQHGRILGRSGGLRPTRAVRRSSPGPQPVLGEVPRLNGYGRDRSFRRSSIVSASSGFLSDR